MGTDPLPAIGISSKKSCDEPILIRLIRSLAHFFYSRALGIGHWVLGIGHGSIISSSYSASPAPPAPPAPPASHTSSFHYCWN
ncbi:hypothetical protein COO91_02707 [Nostoc flagelliforme CCNUN1]|uniref:Uncharacterized protein n=1 Tax=Nostoc flagelliforme CCNUN1 TaxID=2038116 RepID=A0A2K8SMU8_9NOSO|nr:hypothetical protein COO91_02707 [Nostoc flagelliforme CCNUN1]